MQDNVHAQLTGQKKMYKIIPLSYTKPTGDQSMITLTIETDQNVKEVEIQLQSVTPNWGMSQSRTEGFISLDDHEYWCVATFPTDGRSDQPGTLTVYT